MKNFFTLTLCFFTLSLTAQEPLTYPYNPDANGDTFVGVSDVLEGISTYDNFFFPEEIMVGDTTLSNWIQILNQTLANQQAVIDSLQASLDSQETQLDSTMIADMISAAGGLGSGGGCDYAFPEGLDGDHINIDLTDDNEYVVPSGKNLYVISIIQQDWVDVIQISGLEIYKGLGLFNATYKQKSDHLFQPIVATEGDVISSSTNNYATITGLLVDKQIDVFNFELEGTLMGGNVTYNVPDGKRLIILNVYTNGQSLYANGNTILSGAYNYYDQGNTTNEGLQSLSVPLIFPSNTSLSIQMGQMSLNGYLVDEDYFADCGGGGSSDEGSGGVSVSQYGDTLFMEDQYIIIPSLSTYNQHIYQPQFGSVSDISNNTYQTLIYGSNEWMIENLRSSHFADGTPLTFDSDFINNGEDYEAIYGNSYHYSAMMDSRNVCPAEWHVSTKTDWEDLINYFIPNSDFSDHYWVAENDNILKTLRSNSLWAAFVGTNQEFFNIVPAGHGYNSPISSIGISAHFWTSTVDTTPNAGDQVYISLGPSSYNIHLSVHSAGQGYKSIRCVKD